MKEMLRGVMGGDSCQDAVPEVVLEWWDTLLASASDAPSAIANLGWGGLSFSLPARTKGDTGIVEVEQIKGRI